MFVLGFEKIAAEQKEENSPSIRKHIGTGYLVGGGLGAAAGAGLAAKGKSIITDIVKKERGAHELTRMRRAAKLPISRLLANGKHLQRGVAGKILRYSLPAGALIGGGIAATTGAHVGAMTGTAHKGYHAAKTYLNKRKEEK
mgnify:CR=1 FL=1